MPDNNKASKKKLTVSLDLLKRQVGDLYTSTYYTPDNSEEFKTQVTDKLDDAIRKSTQNDDEFQNLSNTSKLFRKLLKNDSTSAVSKLNKSFGKGTADDITSLFQNSDMIASLMESYTKTKWITELDNEFDLICKYMAKLQTALDLKRDTVLCSDSFTKKFLNVRAKGENPASDKNASIQNNIDVMIKKYGLADKVEQWYENTSKYGEEFVYCVPYSAALSELLKRKKNTTYSVYEANICRKDIQDYLPKNLNGSASAIIGESGDPIIKINLDTSKVLMDVVENNIFLRKAAGDSKLKGLSESFTIHEDSISSTPVHSKTKISQIKFDKVMKDEVPLETEEDKTASNGLVTSTSDKDQKINLKVNGAVLKSIKHDKIIPIYIEDVMFGAYYIKYHRFEDVDLNSSGKFRGYNSITGMFNNGLAGSTDGSPNADQANQNDKLLRTIAGQISQKIDKAFINANTDLKKEIYLLLKFNDKYNQVSNIMDMDIVFIPADDIHHLKFREDPETHRGISDLWDALVPAKQWITLNLTTILGWTTRGFDRRIYYVKQSLDTNTAQSLLNVIATIKKGNFGVRQMESVNNILNIVGRFNDFVIPTSPSGEPPIQFDTQAGQQFDFPEQLTQTLEEAAINSTGVPLEVVNSSMQMDFAVRYSMNNAKLLRNVLKRQMKVEDFLSEIFTKIYKFEFNENLELEVTLPPPAFLSMSQGTQLVTAATQYADAIVEVEMAGESDEARQLFKKRLIRKLIPSYLSDEEMQDIKDNVILDKSTGSSSQLEDETGM